MLPRLIPLVLVESNRAVHTVRFGRGQYLGDPLNICRLFSGFGADEIMVLDRTSGRGPTVLESGVLARIAREVSVPLAYGGGLRKPADVERAFRAGADKVVIRSDRRQSPELIRWTASEFGAQATAVCINFDSSTALFRRSHVNTIGLVVEHALDFSRFGAGEVIVQSVRRGGTKGGLDSDPMLQVRKLLSVPMILSGGASSPQDIDHAFRNGFSGVAVSTLFSLDDKSGAPLVSYLSEADRDKFGWLTQVSSATDANV